MGVNTTHEYETATLKFAVIEPVNGGTDHYTIAAFETDGDAIAYCEYRNGQPHGDYDYEVKPIGSKYRDADGVHV